MSVKASLHVERNQDLDSELTKKVVELRISDKNDHIYLVLDNVTINVDTQI